jgi:hypothetical protein
LLSNNDSANFSGEDGCGFLSAVKTDTTNNKGGNLAFTYYLRKNKVPNYFPLFRNTTSVFIKTLISFVFDPDGLSDYPSDIPSYDEKVPPVNLRQEILNKSSVIIDWNTDRDLNLNSFKSLVSWFVDTFNEVVEAALEDGSAGVSANFCQKWMSLFCDINYRSVYSYVIYTLLLPAILVVQSKNAPGAVVPPHTYLGYVSKSSKVFPYSESYDTEFWRGKKYSDSTYDKPSVTLGETVINTDFNKTLIKGEWCFPFSYDGMGNTISNDYPLSPFPEPFVVSDVPGVTFSDEIYKGKKDALLSQVYATIDGDYTEYTQGALVGTFKSVNYPSGSNDMYNDKRTVTMFNPAYDVYYIHPLTVEKWMSMNNSIYNMGNVQAQFNMAFTAEIVMLYHFSKKFRDVSSNAMLWNLPLGVPCLRPDFQNVLQSKNNYASYEIVNNCIKAKTVTQKSYIQYAFESIIEGTNLDIFTLNIPTFGYELFDLISDTGNENLNVTNLNTSETDTTVTKIVVKLGPLDSSLLGSYTEVAQVYVPVFQVSVNGSVIKVQYNDCQFDASNSKLAAAKQLLSNKAYIYVSNPSGDAGSYTIESVRDQASGAYKISYFKIKFEGKELKGSPTIIKRRVY